MPELPEVETIVRGLRSLVLGKTINHIQLLGRPTFRSKVPLFLRSLPPSQIKEIRRHGKSIFIQCDKYCLRIHLGMTGQLLWGSSTSVVKPHTHVIFHLKDEAFQLRFCDIRRFGQLELVPKPPESSQIPDAWDADIHLLFKALFKKKVFLKPALLSQKYISGLGNIYVDESLFMAGLHPKKKLSRLTAAQLMRLCESIKKVLGTSLDQGGTSFRNYVDVSGGRGGFKEHLLVYGKQGQPCPGCQNPIAKTVIAGRGTHYCRVCQR